MPCLKKSIQLILGRCDMKNKLIILMVLLFSTLTSCSIIDNTNSFIGKIIDSFGTKVNDNYKYTIWNISFRLTENKEERTINDKAFNEYIEHYGLIKEKLKIVFLGYDSGSSIRGVHGWLGRNWIRAYEIRASFMERPFEVWIDNRTHEIFGDNFYEVLSRDDKFQHLYSEWVKKQVGIEDENVEFGFTGNYDKPYIEFDKITSLSDDYSEVFENTHNLLLDVIKYDNKFRIEETNCEKKFYDIKNNYYEKTKTLIPPIDRKYSLFVYTNDYEYIYNFPEEKIVSIRKK